MLRIPLLRTLSMFLTGVFVISPISIYSQSVCPIKTVKVGSLNGRVVDAVKGVAPWTNVTVVLRANNDEQTRLSSTTTDENGYFKFRTRTEGRYLLDFSTSMFPTYRAVVRLGNSRKTSAKPWLIVRLGSDCWESDIAPLK